MIARRIVDWGLLPVLILMLSWWIVVRPVFDTDTWFHQAFGQKVLESSEIPRLDEFSHTAYRADWISSGWLSSVFFAFINKHTLDSQAGAIYLTLGVVAAAYLLAYALARRRSRYGNVIGILLLLGIVLAAVRFNPRPDVFSHLMLVVLLGILVWWDRRWIDPATNRKRLAMAGGAAVFVTLAVWANLHAGFLIAFPILALFAAGQWMQVDAGKKYLLIACLFGLTGWLLNPYGVRLLFLPQRIAEIDQVSLISEWMPFFGGVTLERTVFATAILIVALWAFLMVNSEGSGRNWRWMVGAVLILMMVQQRRHSGLVAIGLPMLLVGLEARPVWKSLSRWPVIAVSALLVVGTGMYLKYQGHLGTGIGAPQVGVQCGALPCVTADYLEVEPPPARIYNDFGAGGFLLNRLNPRTQVFIDGRLDIYPPEVWADYVALHEGRLTPTDLEEKYEIRTWVVEIAEGGLQPVHLASQLAAQPGLALVHFDDTGAVFVRRNEVTAAYIEKNEFKLVNPWKPNNVVTAAKGADMTALSEEVVRALQQSQGSSYASALAAIAARSAGDLETAAYYREQAAARKPDNPLLTVLE